MCCGRLRWTNSDSYDVCVKEQEPTISMGAGNTLGWALCFEISLGLFALIIGHELTEVWPAEYLEWPVSPWAIAFGIAGAIPPLPIMLGIRKAAWKPLQELTQFVDVKLTPMFRELNPAKLALLSLAAGWGEELLFRGLIQAEIAQVVNPLTGILAASLVFSLLHFITPAYLVIAFLISAYFGWLYWYFESLWIPILSHATYDFLVLTYLQKTDSAR